MTKSELRQKYKILRSGLSASNIEDLSLNIANNCLQLPIWDYSFYHIYLSILEHKEINTEYLLNILAGKDKHIVIPKSNFETSSLSHFLLTDSTTIKKNNWNIPEPVDGIPISETQIEVIFIPLLAFDTKGNRVGYGKGFYDNFLAKCNPDTLKIGLSFFNPEEEVSNINDSDIPLNYCITPSKIYAF